MDVLHDTPYRAQLDAVLDADGSSARVAQLKATFAFDSNGALKVSEAQEPLRAVDEYAGEPGMSSVLHASDGAFFKPATDVVFVGSIVSPGRRGVSRLNVGIQVGPVRRNLVVWGDRCWRDGMLGTTISPPERFSEMPIRWERAFGGWDRSHADPGKHRGEGRNPIGTGFRAPGSKRSLDSQNLPNFEEADALISSANDTPKPAGLGWTDRSWTPRAACAGHFDEAWRRNRRPLLPVDFDYRFFNGAPPSSIAPGLFDGGELVVLRGMTEFGVVGFHLPRMQVRFRGTARRRAYDERARLDTVEIDPSRCTLALTWRLKVQVLVNEPADLISARVQRFD